MNNNRKFFLNLKSDVISLNISDHNEQYVLDSFDPNEPAASVNLKQLFKLAKALNSKVPKIEVNIPENLLKNETLITNKPISNNEAIEIINKRNTDNKSGIISLNFESIGNRATSITYIQISLINEVKEFVEKAGFIITRFNIGKYSFLNKNTQKINLKYFESFNHLKIKSFSRPILGLILFLFFGFMSLSYIGENIVKYHEPQIKLEGTTIKVDFKHFNENLKINFSNDLISKNELSLINTSLKRFDEFDIKSNSYNLKIFPILSTVTQDISINKIYISNELFLGNDLNHKKLQTKLVNTKETINKKISNLSNVQSLKNITNYKTLFVVQDNENLSNQRKKLSTDFKKIIAAYNPEIKTLNRSINNETEEKSNIDLIPVDDNNVKKNKGNEIKEKYPELETSVVEYAIKISPYQKPLIINSIKILSEPTLSSGALVFTKVPKKRPDYFKDLKVIKPSQIKITAKATRAPSIPEKASVGYNSTKRNFIDLERTNLIGIVGKSSNPSALLRLSNGKIIKIKVGQWFEGWRVYAIDRDKIHVENGFKQEILRMPG